MGGGWFGEELLDEGCDLFDEGIVGRLVGGPGESGVDLFDEAVAAEEEGGGPAVEVVGLRNLLVELVSVSGHENGVGNVVPGDEGVQAAEVLQLALFLEGEVDDLQALAWNCL